MVYQCKGRKVILLLLCLLIANLFCYPAIGQAEENGPLVLKEGMESDAVFELQIRLNKLGFLPAEPTGYFGSLTTKAVKEFQKAQGLSIDGVAGPTTLKKISNIGVKKKITSNKKKLVHRSGKRVGELLPWFGAAERIFSRGCTALVTDVDTGQSFWVKRTQGTNHADCETLTAEDTAIMKSIYGGNWNWDRRAIILTVNGRRIAASIAGMPHGNEYIGNNDMEGHFDIHFYGSRTHGSNSVNAWHQSMIQKAAGYN